MTEPRYEIREHDDDPDFPLDEARRGGEGMSDRCRATIEIAELGEARTLTCLRSSHEGEDVHWSPFYEWGRWGIHTSIRYIESPEARIEMAKAIGRALDRADVTLSIQNPLGAPAGIQTPSRPTSGPSEQEAP